MRFEIVVRIVGLLILTIGVVEYFSFGHAYPQPFIFSTTLIILSFCYERWQKFVLSVALLLSVIVPTMAIFLYVTGFFPDHPLSHVIPVFDVIVFGWIIWSAVTTFYKPNKGYTNE